MSDDIYIVESWPPADPHDRTRTDCRDWQEADALARELAREGDHAVVLHVEAAYDADNVPPAPRNGVRPGLDFPATLAPSGRTLAA